MVELLGCSKDEASFRPGNELLLLRYAPRYLSKTISHARNGAFMEYMGRLERAGSVWYELFFEVYERYFVINQDVYQVQLSTSDGT